MQRTPSQRSSPLWEIFDKKSHVRATIGQGRELSAVLVAYRKWDDLEEPVTNTLPLGSDVTLET
jgi:hypothetical protein